MGDIILTYPFDQYQRYKNTQLLIDAIRQGNETFSVLEVGANYHKNLEKFLDRDNIKYLDQVVLEELRHDPDYIEGDATNLSMEDESFDICVALDVLEHVPSEKREAFFTELCRVSKKLVIVAAPFFSPEVAATEKTLNEYYKSLYNIDFPWLKEHLERGLPVLSEIESMLADHRILHVSFPHGSLSLWKRLMRLHFLVDRKHSIHGYRTQMDAIYNDTLFDQDYVTDAYRHFVVCAKTREIQEIVIAFHAGKRQLTRPDTKVFDDMEAVLNTILSSQVLDRSNEIVTGVHQLYQLAHQVIEVSRQLEEKEKQLREKLSRYEGILISHRIDTETGIQSTDYDEIKIILKIVSKVIRKMTPKWLKSVMKKLFFRHSHS